MSLFSEKGSLSFSLTSLFNICLAPAHLAEQQCKCQEHIKSSEFYSYFNWICIHLFCISTASYNFFYWNYQCTELFWVFIHRLRLEDAELVQLVGCPRRDWISSAWTVHVNFISIVIKCSTAANFTGNKMTSYLTYLFINKVYERRSWEYYLVLKQLGYISLKKYNVQLRFPFTFYSIAK